MRLTAAFLRYELRTQARSLRFRLVATAYLALSLAPVVAHLSQARRGTTISGAASYAAELFTLLPTASSFLAAALGLDAILRERDLGAWPVVTLAPLSNAGYLLRRFLALFLLMVALSGLAVALAAGIAAAGGVPPTAAGPFVGPWLLTVVPVLAGYSAAALGLGTIADSAILGGILLILAIDLLPGLANNFLAASQRKLSPPAAALGTASLVLRISSLRLARDSSLRGIHLILPATEGPYDWRAAAGIALALEALPLGAALALLAAAAPFLRRSRADLRPWKVAAQHPLRSYLALANRLRQRYSLDPKAQPVDRLLGLAGALALALGLGIWLVRDGHYRALAAARHRTEAGRPAAPTPAAIAPERFAVTAELDAGGGVRSTVEAAFANTGTVPCPRLAFELNPGLRVDRLTAGRGTARMSRSWNRLLVALAPPLAPGESRRLRFALHGTPAAARFNLPGPDSNSFETSYRYFSTRRFAVDLTDLAASWTERALSPRRVELAAADLLPLPRFSPWELTPPPTTESGTGLEVPEEHSATLTELRFELRAPAGLMLAESCGTATWGGGRLAGTCLTPLSEWAVRGGRLVPVAAAGLRLAALPPHRERVRFHATGLALLRRQVEEAWPGLALPDPVLLEWPPAFDPDPFAQMGGWTPWGNERQPEPRSVGRILLLPEHLLAGSRRIPSAGLAGELVAGELLRRRPLARADQALLNDLLRAVVLRRLGRGPADGAVITGRRFEVSYFAIPIVEPRAYYYRYYYEVRLAAVLADLEHRAGPARFQQAIETFLARRGGPPGTVAELLSTIGREAGLDLDAFYRDYFAGSALPEVGLADVRVAHGAGYSVTGAVTSRGQGEARCPVVVTTELGQTAIEVRVEGGGRAAFRVDTPYRPSAVRLDPDGICHRFRSATPGQTIERVELHPEAAR